MVLCICKESELCIQNNLVLLVSHHTNTTGLVHLFYLCICARWVSDNRKLHHLDFLPITPHRLHQSEQKSMRCTALPPFR